MQDLNLEKKQQVQYLNYLWQNPLLDEAEKRAFLEQLRQLLATLEKKPS